MHNSKLIYQLNCMGKSIRMKRVNQNAHFCCLFSAGNDILICGTCKSMYSSLATFVQHKKQKCELKTLCRCQNQPIVENSFPGKLTTKAR